MGTDDEYRYPGDGEGPAREVTLSPYRISRHAVTNDQFADFVQRSASGAKYNASNRRHLLRLLAALKVAALKVADTA